jgi:RNA polymerase sigma-70 factor (ECF subfamily)
MIGFAKAVSDYPLDAWKNLFYKILLRRITDHQRKQTWRNKIVQILNFSQLPQAGDEEGTGVPEYQTTEHAGACHDASELADAFEIALGQLAPRQQEAYLLRQWQGMSVAETAVAMNCSQGSVKTHLSRAMQALRKALGDWVN